MISFDAAHEAVHYPKDRRFRIWIRPTILVWTGVVILSVIAASWIEFAVAGLPHIPPIRDRTVFRFGSAIVTSSISFLS